MPANLTPEYRQAEQDFRQATTAEERLSCLQRMLSVIPKHKGTDRLQGDLKRKIAQLKKSISADRRRKKNLSFRVKPEGAGQIMLVGPPNVGKSSLLAALTRASPDVAEYPCTTREPMPGMVVWEGVQIQLVDLPPVWREHCESFVFDNIRAADALLVVADLTAPDPAAQVAETLALLRDKGTKLAPARLEPIPCPAPAGEGIEYIVLANKTDSDPDGQILDLVRELLEETPPLHAVSARTGEGLDELRTMLFGILHVIRIYSKQPGKRPDLEQPFTVPVGSTVLDFAGHVHGDLVSDFKSARVWGSARFDGQTVQRDHVLQDRDVVELAAR